MGPLSGLRAIDLTDEIGLYCGSLLGGLGVDVIAVEKPGGARARNKAPFYHDVPHPEKSLYWMGYSINKRGITLNIETADGQDILKRLLKTTDFIIESFQPGYLDKLGIGYAILAQIKPDVIKTSITHFGQTGPHANYKGSDIVAMAMGGYMYITGDPDRPPIRLSLDQAELHASAHAAAGTLIAYYNRERTGEGQEIDVSLQESVICLIPQEIVNWQFTGSNSPREGSRVRRGAVLQNELWDCSDGEVGFRIMGGRYGRGIQPLADWMAEEGLAGAVARVEKWEEVDLGKVTQEEADSWEHAFGNFFKQHTKAEIYEQAVKRGIYLLPSGTAKDVVENKQLAARGYWEQVEHAELNDTITHPGNPFVLSRTPWQVYRRPPLIGEHNTEIYGGELGFTMQELIALKQAGVI